MDSSFLPEPKALILCGDVVTDPESGNVHLLRVFNDIRPNPPQPYPHCHAEFCVFLQLSDTHGEVPAYVQVIRADSLELVYRTPTHIILFADRQSLVRVCFRIRNCTFPTPGVYWSEFYPHSQFVTDRVVRLLEPGD
jgi:hypothetical protein